MKKVNKSILGGRFNVPDIKNLRGLSRLFGYLSRHDAVNINNKKYEELGNDVITIQEAHDDFDRKYRKYMPNVKTF